MQRLSAYQKPDGLTIVPPDEAQTWLAPLSVSHLWGVGPKTEKRLHALGLYKIGDVSAADLDWLEVKLGSAGHHIFALAHAEDPRPVEGRRSSKSVGSERTFAQDVQDKNEIRRYLHRSAEEIGRRLRRKRYVAFGVRVKLKTNEFQILTRQHQLQQPTDVAAELYADASIILDAFDHPGPFRLVGMSAYDLVAVEETAQLDLFAHGIRRRRLETAIDELKQRFGPNVVRSADDLGGGRQTPNLDFIHEADDSDDS